MRISKVEVSKGKVIVGKNCSTGYVEHQKDITVQHNDQASIIDFLQDKEQNFLLSLLNKTLIKDIPRSWNKVSPTDSKEIKENARKQHQHDKYNLRNLRKLLKAVVENNINREEITIKYIKKLDIKKIKEYFHHKFSDNMVYYDLANIKQEFSLSELICHALQKNEVQQIIIALKPYKKWVEYFIKTKQEKIAKSIVHNKILVADESVSDSPRKIALQQWANSIIDNNLDLQNEQNKFELTKLMADIRLYFDEVEKYDTDDLVKRQVKGFPTNYQKFKCGVKDIYKQHRRYLCGKNVLHDNLVQQYSLEVGKYLDLYFPVKKSGKRLSVEDIKFYLEDNTISSRIKSQIYNATLQFIIQQGKFLHYDLQQNADSNKLQQIKAQEVFALKFIEACAFASNNLRNAINSSTLEDILGKKTILLSLQSYLNSNTLSNCVEKLFDFYYLDNQEQTTLFNLIKSDNLKCINFCGAVRSSIQRIRNKVVHFKQDALNEFLPLSTPTTYEAFKITSPTKIENDPSIDYSSSPLQELLKIELQEIPFFLFEKLNSSLVLDYYKLEDLRNIFSGYNLQPRLLHFAPSFKKIFSQGRRIQDEAGNTYKTQVYFKDEPAEVNKCMAHKNALHLIYENQFMQTFLNDKTAFYSSVNNVICYNKKVNDSGKNSQEFTFQQNDSSRNNQKFAFQQIEVFYKTIRNDKSPIDFLIEIQSLLILEENAKRDEGKLEYTDTGHFQNFLYYLFMKGFDSFIENNKNFEFVKSPKEQTESNQYNSKEEIKEALQALSLLEPNHTISSTNSLHIALWSFAKLLDMNHLNELSNQISKLKQFEAKFGASNLSGIQVNLTAFQEILNLCILSSEKFYDKNSLSLDEITPYIDPCYSLCSDHSPYVQSDNRTPVLFSQLKLVKRYATENVLNKVLRPYKIKQEEIEKWLLEQDNIANYMSERQMLHNNWANSSNKKGKNNWFTETSKIAGTDKKTRYKTINQKIEEYNWLDNKIHLVHVKKLHNLLLEILARLVGFVALWERDFQFINNILSQEYGFKNLKFENGFPNLREYDNWKNFMSDTFVPSCASDYRDYRNFLAHFNYLTQFSGGSTSTKSLLKLIEDTRKIVSYDRKLKNAVTKSIIDIIDRHGIELAFKPLYVNSHQLVIEKCEPKKIMHLKHKELEFNQVSTEYANMVKSLLEYQ